MADPRPMTEAQLQAAVIKICRFYLLKWHHQQYSNCDGGPLGPSLPVPHVHPYRGPALAVDLLSGWTAAGY